MPRKQLYSIANVDTRVKTARRSVDVLAFGKEFLLQKGIKAWAKSYTKWVRGVMSGTGGDSDENSDEEDQPEEGGAGDIIIQTASLT